MPSQSHGAEGSWEVEIGVLERLDAQSFLQLRPMHSKRRQKLMRAARVAAVVAIKTG